MVKIKLNPRIHMNLFDLSSTGYRKYGGIGFSILHDTYWIELKESTALNVKFLSKIGFTVDDLSAIERKAQEVCSHFSLQKMITVVNAGEIRRHVGLGSGTSITMAIIEFLFIVNGINATPETIIKWSGRGGTSGVGVHTYFYGGLTVDLGRKADLDEHKRSGDQSSFEPPLLLSQTEMPNWKCGIFVPNDIVPLGANDERSFFSATTPIPISDVEHALYEAISGIYASIKECDFDGFCTSINQTQSTFWKNAEISLYGEKMKQYISQLSKLGAQCVGMSSLGPMLYFFSSNTEECAKKVVKRFPGCYVKVCAVANQGRTIEYA